ncbi:hypothetical protein [Psychrobacter sp. 72-O-c]|uniref:hypothetical protein n=1 Tax=Psychrobacter sp. 72-O-c TaxID=2774125 RepID=UPI001D10E9AA|nr:hypothetical protein [Psychrobacter sp. 72-O-c]
MNQLSSLLKTSKPLKSRRYQSSLASIILMATISVQAAPTVTATDPAVDSAATPPVAGQTNSSQSLPYSTLNSTMPATNTLASQLQPSNKALSAANQDLLSRNAQLQRQVNDLQTQVSVLIYESKGQLFLYGAFTVLISLLVGIFISWLVFVRRERW